MTDVTVTHLAPARTPRAGARLRMPAWLGLLPFGAYTLLFLLVPAALAVATAFRDADGGFTLDGILAMGSAPVLNAFTSSLWLSTVTALIGSALGALVCFALLGLRGSGAVRTVVDAFASVLAQFGGVMLAFAFIATIGIQGMVTRGLLEHFGIDLYRDGVWLYQVPGLVLPYLYFQVPLMIIVFMPALEGLRPQWAEANAILGGTSLGFWRRIGLPVLAPSLLSSFVLLFANAFSAYGTAAALISQGTQIVPLQIRAALVSETVLGREYLAGSLAIGMLAVMVVLILVSALLQRRAARWQR